MKKLFTLLFLSVIFLTAAAQDFNYGGLKPADYHYDKKALDDNANAVVLNEYGNARMEVNESTHYVEIVFYYHIRIKIYNDKGFNQANIVVPLYKDDMREERISVVEGSTFNLNGGQMEETKLDSRKTFEENRSKYTRLAKFTMPNIKPGSVIEYRYRINSPLLFNFRTWEFQSDIPKVNSEYVAMIPPIYNYNVSLRGPLQLTSSNGEVADDCMVYSGTRLQCSKMTYIMKNIPAFVEEEYMTAASNFKSAIYFELSDEVGLNGGKVSYTKEWRDVDNELNTNKYFGSQLKRKDVFKDRIPGVIKDAADDLGKAKAVYNFIKKEIKWNNIYGKYSEDNIKKAFETHSGNVGDINLSLANALTTAGLDAEVVMLSTRDNGTPNKLFPVLSDFNYVVAKVNIGDKSYMLDASDPLLPFGLLPLRCINDQGRVLNLKKPSYWIDMKADQKSNTTYSLNGTLNDNGKIVGKMTIFTTGYAALNKRKEIKGQNSIDEYVEKWDEKLPKTTILKHSITNLDSLDKTLSEEYEIEMQVFEGNQGDKFLLNPFLVNRMTENPFKLNERLYPVDMGYASTQQNMINIVLNGNYALEDKPKDVSIALPNNGGRYLVKTTLEDKILNVSQSVQINKPRFEVNEYPSLKEFFSQIIQVQKTDFLLKKAN